MYNVNCTGEQHKNCSIIGTSIYPEIIAGFIILLSFIGVILNVLSLYIFVFSNNMNNKFLNYLKWYLGNSILVCLNYLIHFTMYFCLNRVMTMMPMGNRNWTSEYFILFYIFMFLPVWTITYTFGSLLDIIIAYERILLYMPTFHFMRNVKIHTYVIVFFVISFLINLPPNISRNFYNFTFHFEQPSNQSVKVFYFALRDFGENNDLFKWVLYVSTFLRDILALVIEFGITVFLLITIVKFYNKKKRLTNKKIAKPAKNDVKPDTVFQKTELNNSKIILMICFISSLNHIGTFLMLLALYFYETIYLFVAAAFGIVLLARHSLNFFIFFKLNKKFRRNFISLIPKCMKVNKEKILNKTVPINSVNNNAFELQADASKRAKAEDRM
jgi:hypothetical protein